MPTTLSPLRYPGGKTKLYSLVKAILDDNNLHGTYIEPFAGGAGLAIKLLLNKDVKRIVINDSDPAIYAFWRCVIYHTEELCLFIENVPLTIDEWENQRSIYFNQNNASEIELGKATLFLNRTNVSGVLKGGVIGGKNQTGVYKIDARFNRKELIKKIQNIAQYKDQIDIYNLDVFDFLKPSIMRHYYKVLINFDPPYVEKAGQLYMNYFSDDDHKKLESTIARCKRNWIVTYDVNELVKNLYNKYRHGYIEVVYSANKSRRENELIVFSDNLIIPEGIKVQ